MGDTVSLKIRIVAVLVLIALSGCKKRNEIWIDYDPNKWDQTAQLTFEMTREDISTNMGVILYDRWNCVSPLEKTRIFDAKIRCFLGDCTAYLPEEPKKVPAGVRINLAGFSGRSADSCQGKVRSYLLEPNRSYRLVFENYNPAQPLNCAIRIVDSNGYVQRPAISSYPDCKDG